MALTTESKKEKSAALAPIALPPGAAAGDVVRPDFNNAPCVGVEDEQNGIEVEDSSGAVWIFPYSVELYAKLWREENRDVLSVVIGGAEIRCIGRGLGLAAEALRRYRLVYLRPLGHDLAKVAPEKTPIITELKVTKHNARGDEHYQKPD